MSKTSDVLQQRETSSGKYYVYTLYSLRDSKFYTGFTVDLRKRLVEHVKGAVRSTRLRRPFRLIHYEYFINESDAKARERFLKSGFGRKQLKLALKKTLVVATVSERMEK